MKLRTLFSALLTLVCLPAMAMAQGESLAPKRTCIAIIGFASRGSDTQSSAIENCIATQLTRNGRCDVIERQNLSGIVSEIKLGETGLLQPGTQKRFGEIKGVDYLVYGCIESYQRKTTHNDPNASVINVIIHPPGTTVNLSMTVRMTEVATGKMVLNEQYKAEQLDRSFDEGSARLGAMGKICRQFGKSLQPIIPSSESGRVILIKPEYVRVDLTRKDGISRGDLIELLLPTRETGLHGEVVVDVTVVCVGRVIEVDDQSAKLEIGRMDGRRFKCDGSLAGSLNGDCIAHKLSDSSR